MTDFSKIKLSFPFYVTPDKNENLVPVGKAQVHARLGKHGDVPVIPVVMIRSGGGYRSLPTGVGKLYPQK